MKPIEVSRDTDIEATVTKPDRGKYLSFRMKCAVLCDDCAYRPKEEGGNGKCGVYEQGSVCVLRANIHKASQDLDTRNPDHLKARLDQVISSGLDEAQVQIELASMSNTPVPKEVIGLLASVNNSAKLMSELTNKKMVNEISESKTFTKDGREELNRKVRQEIETTD